MMVFSYISTYVFFVITRSFATNNTRPRLFQYQVHSTHIIRDILTAQVKWLEAEQAFANTDHVAQVSAMIDRDSGFGKVLLDRASQVTRMTYQTKWRREIGPKIILFFPSNYHLHLSSTFLATCVIQALDFHDQSYDCAKIQYLTIIH